MDTCCPGTSQRSYSESKLLQGRLPGCWAGETPHTPASLLRAHFSLSQLSCVQSWISRQWMWKNKHTICPEPPRRFPGLSFCQQKAASWRTLCLPPSLLSQYRCFSWEAHPFILMPNAPAARAVTDFPGSSGDCARPPPGGGGDQAPSLFLELLPAPSSCLLICTSLTPTTPDTRRLSKSHPLEVAMTLHRD